MTWQKFMTYAHQNIELRPIPFIENPLPGRSQEAVAATAQKETEEAAPPARPKLLSEKAEQALRQLEEKLRQAQPLKHDQELAKSGKQPIITQ